MHDDSGPGTEKTGNPRTAFDAAVERKKPSRKNKSHSFLVPARVYLREHGRQRYITALERKKKKGVSRCNKTTDGGLGSRCTREYKAAGFKDNRLRADLLLSRVTPLQAPAASIYTHTHIDNTYTYTDGGVSRRAIHNERRALVAREPECKHRQTESSSSSSRYYIH